VGRIVPSAAGESAAEQRAVEQDAVQHAVVRQIAVVLGAVEQVATRGAAVAQNAVGQDAVGQDAAKQPVVEQDVRPRATGGSLAATGPSRNGHRARPPAPGWPASPTSRRSPRTSIPVRCTAPFGPSCGACRRTWPRSWRRTW